jgi:ATP-binding cassette subfamily B protein
VREEKSEITSIYFYAIGSGLIQLTLPLGIQAIIGFVLGGTLSASLTLLIGLVVGGVLIVGLMQINQMKLIEKIQQKIFVNYAYRFADHIPRIDLQKADAFYLPELVNRFFDTPALQKSISKLLLDLPSATIQILFGLILLSFYHPIFILFGIVLILVLWLILYVTGNKGLQTSLAESTHKYAVAGWFEEMARVIKPFKFAAGTLLHFRKANEKTSAYLAARTQHFLILLLQYRTLVAFKVVITASMLIVGVLLLLDQQINIGQFVAAEIIIITIINAIEKIIMNLDSVYDALTSIEKLNKLLDKPAEVSGNYEPDLHNGISLQVRQLHFGYEDRTILDGINFRVEAGQKVCITGREGSGKSTLLKLMTGAYPEFKGSLLVNDIPIGNYNLATLREHTGILFRQENIFFGTFWENITMGKEVADRDYIYSLIRQTGLQAYLNTLPQGFDTILDPAGKRLPSNVILKMLIVRALAHKPSLLLLEDPLQGVEEQHKQPIRDLLLNLPGATVIIASNEPLVTDGCQQVIAL